MKFSVNQLIALYAFTITPSLSSGSEIVTSIDKKYQRSKIDNVCEFEYPSCKVFKDGTVDNSGVQRCYDALAIPCDSYAFDISFSADQIEGTYVFISDANGPFVSTGIAVEFIDNNGENVVSLGNIASSKKSATFLSNDNFDVKITSDKNGFSVFVDNMLLISSPEAELVYQNAFSEGPMNIHFGSNGASAIISDIKVMCDGSDNACKEMAYLPKATKFIQLVKKNDGLCISEAGNIEGLQGSSDSPVPLYDTSNIKSIPCSSLNFEFSFEVDRTSDIYFLVTNDKGINQDIALGGQVGLISGSYGLGDSVFTNSVSAAPSSPTTATVTIKSSDTDLSMYIDDVLYGSIDPRDNDYPELLSPGAKKIYFAAEVDGTSINNIKISCSDQGGECLADTSASTESSESRSETTFTFAPMELNSGGIPKNYGQNAIEIPCESSDFQLDFTVNSQDDLFVAFVNEDGLPTSSIIVESQIGIASGRNVFRAGRYSAPTKRNFTKRQTENTQVVVKYQYINGTLFMYKNDALASSIKVPGISIKNAYFAPLQSTASIDDGQITCL
ncbi:hypothetical protein AYI69_g8811 [Smittium culicis]|uniref:Uncharacterized protein n=1 Tax=Smittium culicis TaxID=133412 RepID=A0A1R1XGX1_9FUNG|nr:hypothetical protein AYI69_g8811 [Smittium culicis]